MFPGLRSSPAGSTQQLSRGLSNTSKVPHPVPAGDCWRFYSSVDCKRISKPGCTCAATLLGKPGNATSKPSTAVGVRSSTHSGDGKQSGFRQEKQKASQSKADGHTQHAAGRQHAKAAHVKPQSGIQRAALAPGRCMTYML